MENGFVNTLLNGFHRLNSTFLLFELLCSLDKRQCCVSKTVNVISLFFIIITSQKACGFYQFKKKNKKFQHFSGVKAPICAVSGAQYLTTNGWSELRNPIDTDVPFRLFRDEERTHLQVSN